MRRFTVAAMTALSVFAAGIANASAMSFWSTDIKPGSTISDEQVAGIFGCKGGDISPALAWKGAPAKTKSFAIQTYDPDAPTGSGFWHWVVFNIPAGTTSIPKGAGDVSKNLMPAGTVQSRTDFGVNGYHGPCPPPGKPHHYWFILSALDVAAIDGGDANTSAAVIGFNLHFHSIAKSKFFGLYGSK